MIWNCFRPRNRRRDDQLRRIVDPEILRIGLVTENRFPESEARRPGLVSVHREDEEDGGEEEDRERHTNHGGHGHRVRHLWHKCYEN